MARRRTKSASYDSFKEMKDGPDRGFYLEFKTNTQKIAWTSYQENEILFMLGPAGCGKSFLAMGFAIQDLLEQKKDKIYMTRPIVEAGEYLGFLPGTLEEKVSPYMTPLYDCMSKLCGRTGNAQKEWVMQNHEVVPLAYLRGRAQPLDAGIMTPNGIVPMGSIEIGDFVIGSDGSPTKVVGVYPQGMKKVYKVTLSDGTSTECCGEHLWSTQSLSEKRHGKGYSVKQTSDLIGKVKNKHGVKYHKIPILSAPVQFAEREVSIDPYLLGLLLGDGSLHPQASITISTKDAEIVESVSKALPAGVEIKYASQYDYRLSTENKWTDNPLRQELKKMDLIGRKSYNKFVPNDYKFNSIEVRLAVLQGLMDSDGCIYKDRKSMRVHYSSSSEQLAKDVVFLVQSLGGVAYIRTRDYDPDRSHPINGRAVRHVHSAYIVDICMEINPFRLSRKKNKFIGKSSPRLIASINEVGEKECRCIKVAAEDHLYLTDNFIVTHNTFDDSICILDEAQNCSFTQVKLFLTRMGQNCKMVITGDPSQTDLHGDSPIADIVSRLEGVPGIGVVHFKEDSIVRHPLVGQVIKRLS